MIQNESVTTIIPRKELPSYPSNPSREAVAVGTRKVNKAGDKMMVIGDGGEYVGTARFHEIEEVDRNKFVKLYVGGITAFDGLSAAASKVFKMLYLYVLDNPDTDSVYLHYKEAKGMGKPTFERGLTELLNKEIIYKSTRANIFFLNITYMFNGNRLALVQEYRLKEENGWKDQPLPL